MENRTFKTFMSENRHLYYVLLLLPIAVAYFLLQLRYPDYTIIHMALDDSIPFIPAFVIPYVLWYLYVPATMIYLAVRGKTAFVRQCVSLFSGAAIGILLFILFPTMIDLRPQTLGKDIFSSLVGIIYANDRPVNVCPSLHCFEAVCAHLTAFTFSGMKSKLWLRIGSAVLTVLICLSTVFIKQHSFLDVIYGVALAMFISTLVWLIMRKDEKA